MRDYTNIACCLAMYYDLEDGYIMYDPVLNCMSYKTTTMPSEDRQVMAYCPHCGSKLPDYNDEFFSEAEKIVGKDGDLDELPEEFRTDEWWRKRGIKGVGKHWETYNPIRINNYE